MLLLLMVMRCDVHPLKIKSQTVSEDEKWCGPWQCASWPLLQGRDLHNSPGWAGCLSRARQPHQQVSPEVTEVNCSQLHCICARELLTHHHTVVPSLYVFVSCSFGWSLRQVGPLPGLLTLLALMALMALMAASLPPLSPPAFSGTPW